MLTTSGKVTPLPQLGKRSLVRPTLDMIVEWDNMLKGLFICTKWWGNLELQLQRQTDRQTGRQTDRHTGWVRQPKWVNEWGRECEWMRADGRTSGWMSWRDQTTEEGDYRPYVYKLTSSATTQAQPRIMCRVHCTHPPPTTTITFIITIITTTAATFNTSTQHFFYQQILLSLLSLSLPSLQIFIPSLTPQIVPPITPLLHI